MRGEMQAGLMDYISQDLQKRLFYKLFLPV